MRFNLFERQADAHLRKSREYLEEANLGRVEHQAAAEHHSALAKMYANRIARIQAEINDGFHARPLAAEPIKEEKLTSAQEEIRLKSEPVVLYSSRASHA